MKKSRKTNNKSNGISKKGQAEYQKLLSAAKKASEGQNPYYSFIENNKAAWKELANK